MLRYMQKGLVSVVIPNYNYARYLREAIDGALAQTHTNTEIIVVDDGSSDASKDILESYGCRLNAIFQKNQGVSAARNNGVRESRGEYVAFLDADDSWQPEKIEKELQRFSRDSSLGLVHVGVREVDGEGGFLGNRLEGGEGWIADTLLMLTSTGVLGGGSGFMVPRAIFDEVGGFDLRLSTSADWDFFYRVACSYQVGFVRETLLNYRVHESNMHGNIDVMERDMRFAFEKAFPGESTPRSRECYGNLYMNLSGSYFRAGNYAAFLRAAAASLGYRPANILYFFGFPLRKIKSGR